MLTPVWMDVQSVWQLGRLFSNQRRSWRICSWVKMKRCRGQADDQWRRYTRTRQIIWPCCNLPYVNRVSSLWNSSRVNNNNNLACIAPVYQRLQRRWRTDYGRENRLGLNVWRNNKVLRVDLNTASEVLEATSLLSEFQTVGAVQQKARSAKWVL